MGETAEHRSADGLRARKRASTTATIERTAIALALEHGYDNVTVDMICGASNVSPRTFFNYFGSKEGAVLGPAVPEIDEQDRAAFIASSSPDVVSDLIAMVTALMIDRGPDHEVMSSRRAVVVNTPSLITKQVDRMGEQESKLTELVLQRFAQQGRSAQQVPGLEDEARMVVALVGTVLRFSARHWFDTRGPLEMSDLMTTNLVLARRVLGVGV